MLTTLKLEILPCPEAELRAALIDYKDALAAHALTVGEPAPVPAFDFLRSLVSVTVVEGQVTVAGDFEVEAPEPEPPAPELTPEQIKQRLVGAVQWHLDTTARERGYDSILSLASYVTSSHVKFSAEGQAGLDWRDAVWDYCGQVLAAVEANQRPIPTAEELIVELPAMVWPD